MKICLFGGSFDPIHSGHLAVAEQVLENNLCDKIWFIPCYKNPLKKEPTKTEHRKKMIEIAIKKKENFELNEIELNKKETNYTLETVKELKKEFPEHKFCFIIAAKALDDFHKWKNPEELLKEIEFIIVSVENALELPLEIQEVNPKKLKPTKHSDVSSTVIRKRIKEGKSVSGLLPEKVFDYIKKNHLYGFK